ncbi:MAG TPA: hypothetical protein VK892_12960 [Pyrinomonadaceae bacterium]|nr:hypothetical protein [Pyrinomonadaceae bacterium]
MREKDQKNNCETETACALAMFLMNMLIFAAIGAVAWLAHLAVAENESLNAILRGGFLP